MGSRATGGPRHARRREPASVWSLLRRRPPRSPIDGAVPPGTPPAAAPTAAAQDPAAPAPPTTAATERSDRARTTQPARAVDGLTGLGDRLALKERLEGMVVFAPSSGPRPALLLVEIDGLAEIGSRHGSVLADMVLAVAARRLVVLTEGAAAYRASGVELAVLLDRVDDLTAVAAAERLVSELGAPTELYGVPLRLSVTVVVVMLGGRDRADALLRDADSAMARARAAGGGRVECFDARLDDWSTRRCDVEALEREIEDLRMENHALKELSATDPLTGLPNQASFDLDHHRQWARRSRSAEPYSIILAEIDGPSVDTEPGVHAGCRPLLVTIADAVAGTVREADRTYRYGEHEFAVLLPGAELRHAVAAAERVRSQVERCSVAHPTEPAVPVTVTVGAIEAGFRHQGAKDVMAELEALLRDGRGVARNRCLWPR